MASVEWCGREEPLKWRELSEFQAQVETKAGVLTLQLDELSRLMLRELEQR
jgi:hypothetical protein